ncbi:F-box protein CPR1-like [Nicotiana tabacum]|uniref:F-box protein CPR1-like n=1 Tax=Nicotiana tabacum TaxID=4097 RepID=A0AC58SM72_TOBAC
MVLDMMRFVMIISSSSDVEVKIYSLKSDSWRSIHSLPQRVRLSGLSWFVNGKLHWDNNTDRFFGNGCNIIYIDLADEKWGKMEQPSYGKGNDLSVNRNDKRKHVSVWVMREYGVNESWSKMFTINYADYPYSYVLPLFMLNKASIATVYSGSVVESVIHFCNFDCHDIAPPENVNRYPVIDLQLSRSPAISASV